MPTAFVVREQVPSFRCEFFAEAGIVARRKDGNRVYYRIGDESVLAICEEVCGSVQRQLDELQQILSGAGR